MYGDCLLMEGTSPFRSSYGVVALLGSFMVVSCKTDAVFDQVFGGIVHKNAGH